MKKVLVWGTFDLLHLGHLNFLKAAKKHGDKLIVLLGRDKIVAQLKGQKPLHKEKERLEMVRGLKIVDEAYLDRLQEDFKLVKKISPAIICLGYDQLAYTVRLHFFLKKHGLKTKVIRLKSYHPEKYKSTMIKKLLVRNRILRNPTK